MKRSIKSRIEIKKNRLKRRSRKIFYETVKASVLIGAIAVTATSMIFIYNYMFHSPYFQLEEVVIEGCGRVTEKEIAALAGVKHFQNILAINLEETARRIRANPWVVDVELERELPDKLVIKLSEKRPIALIKKDGDIYFVDSDGFMFEKLGKGENADLPVLTGFDKNADLLKKSTELIACLSSRGMFPEINDVSEIRGDDIFGFSLVTNGGICIELGFESYMEKLERLKPVMADLAVKNLDRGFLHINLRDPGRVIVQKRVQGSEVHCSTVQRFNG